MRREYNGYEVACNIGYFTADWTPSNSDQFTFVDCVILGSKVIAMLIKLLLHL